MRNSLFSAGSLGEFILAELNRRGIRTPETPQLPELLGSWRTRVTPAGSLVLEVRACAFEDAASFCFALFVPSKRKSPRVTGINRSSTGTTLSINAHQGFDNDGPRRDREFDFDVLDGSGTYHRTDSSITVFFHRDGTTTFVVAEAKEGLEIAFIDHKTV